MIVRKRIQTQTLKGCVDRVFTVTFGPLDPARLSRLRGTWFTAKDRLQADSGLAMLEQLCLDSARAGKGDECLRELDNHKGLNIHAVHKSVEPKILRGK